MMVANCLLIKFPKSSVEVFGFWKHIFHQHALRFSHCQPLCIMSNMVKHLLKFQGAEKMFFLKKLFEASTLLKFIYKSQLSSLF
jgi:hypothetical protein